jgi:pimeloyl-ACP methyl ester carboxylesterase
MKPMMNVGTRARVAMLGVGAAIFVTASISRGQQTPAARRATARGSFLARHAFVNGVNMYYEIHGTRGRPLVLLHGAFSNIQSDFGKILPTLAKNRQVIAIEQQGHGHTADIDRPLTYEQMADDVAELLRQLRISKADFFGYSMGGGIATYVAVRHPGLVRKLVWAGGAAYSPEGFYPELMEGEKKMKPEDFAGTPWLRAYKRIAPNRGDWPKLVAKIKDLDLAWRGLSPEQVRSIKAPTLLIVGDADIVRPEHVVEMFRLLGGGVPGDLAGLPRSQLAVLPGTTHVTLIARTDWLLSMITPFLDSPMPGGK